MYDWKEIALMYKEEANRLCDDVHEAFDHIIAKAPHSISKAEKILSGSCSGPSSQLDFIESFERMADSRKERPSEPMVQKCGRILDSRNYFEEEEYENITDMFYHLQDTKKYISTVMEKYALLVSMKKFRDKGVTVLNTSIEDNKDNVFTVIDKRTKRERTIKVVASGMSFAGKTKPFNKDLPLMLVPSQRTYLIDPKESVKDRYFFVDFDEKNKSITFCAWIKGQHLNELLVDPLRERFVGKKACILQKTGYNKGTESPYSIYELLNRRK